MMLDNNFDILLMRSDCISFLLMYGLYIYPHHQKGGGIYELFVTMYLPTGGWTGVLGVLPGWGTGHLLVARWMCHSFFVLCKYPDPSFFQGLVVVGVQ